MTIIESMMCPDCYSSLQEFVFRYISYIDGVFMDRLNILKDLIFAAVGFGIGLTSCMIEPQCNKSKCLSQTLRRRTQPQQD